MNGIKYFQIPSSIEEEKLYREAAKRHGLSVVEWAHRILRREATRATRLQTLGDVLNEVATFGEVPEIEPPKREGPRNLKGE